MKWREGRGRKTVYNRVPGTVPGTGGVPDDVVVTTQDKKGEKRKLHRQRLIVTTARARFNYTKFEETKDLALRSYKFSKFIAFYPYTYNKGAEAKQPIDYSLHRKLLQNVRARKLQQLSSTKMFFPEHMHNARRSLFRY